MRSGMTRRELLGAVATATAAGVVPQATRAEQHEDWPAVGYDPARTGHNPDGDGPTGDVGGGWRFTGPGDAISSGAAVVDGIVYAASRDGNLYAVDGTSGDPVDGWPVDLGSESAAAPTVVEGTVYVGDDGGVLHAVDTETAEQQWRFETDGPIVGGPVRFDGRVYTTSTDGTIYAVDAESGEQAAWSFEMGAGIEGGVALEQRADGATVYAGNSGGDVVALDAETGEERWEEPFPAVGQVQSPPTVVDGTVYVTTVNGNEGVVYAIDAETGEQQWVTERGGAIIGSPAVTADSVYIGARDTVISALDVDTGDEQWRFDTNRQIIASPAVVGETVYITDFGGTVIGLTPAGDERFTTELSARITASPAVADGRIYVGSEDGTLYALESGGEFAPEPPDDSEETPVTNSPLADSDPPEFAFLILPASIATLFGLLAGGLYVVFRSDWTDKFAVDEAPVEALYDDEEGDERIPDYDDRTETETWSLIVGDTISRAAERTKMATENLIVTKYLDTALDSPITAYEIESARDEPVRVTLTEALLDDDDQFDDQPLNEGWSRSGDQLVFETTLQPDKQVRTMVGRTDCPDGEAEQLLENPEMTIEPLESPDVAE